MDDIDSNPGSSAATVPQASFRRRFTRQWRDSVRYFGFWRALGEVAAAFGHATLELLPSRRKARFGDLDYDCEHEVDTTRSNVSFRAQLQAELVGRPYFASEPWLFEQMMQALALSIQQSAVSQGVVAQAGFEDFTFIDLGSGKGRALLMAASCGFKRIIGVEFVPEWHRAAEENIRKFSTAHPGSSPIESICMDARDFEFPAGPLVVYLFNPFLESTFAALMERLRQSLLENPRPVFVQYRYIEFEGLLAKYDWLEKLESTEQWAVFRNRRIGKANLTTDKHGSH
jgi:Methyltransferase domain